MEDGRKAIPICKDVDLMQARKTMLAIDNLIDGNLNVYLNAVKNDKGSYDVYIVEKER